MNGLRVRGEVNKLMGVDSRLIDAKEIKELVPSIDISPRMRYPILGALYHPPGGTIRHDAVVWGYGKEADRQGVSIHPFTEAVGISTDKGRVTAVQTSRGEIKTGTVVNATAGFCSIVSKLANIELPVVTHPLQAFVTEPLTPFLDHVVVSATLHVYASQTDRGELVIGSEIDPYSSYSTRSTLAFLQSSAAMSSSCSPVFATSRCCASGRVSVT